MKQVIRILKLMTGFQAAHGEVEDVARHNIQQPDHNNYLSSSLTPVHDVRFHRFAIPVICISNGNPRSDWDPSTDAPFPMVEEETQGERNAVDKQAADQ